MIEKENENQKNIVSKSENDTNLNDKSLVDIEKSDDLKNNKKLFNGQKKWLKILYYLIIGLIPIIIRFLDINVEVGLGDFGSLVPALLSIFILVGLKWLPLLSLFGIVITIFEEGFKEISKIYIVTLGFIFVFTLLILCIVVI